MIVDVQIDRLQSGLYRVSPEMGRVSASEESIYSSIKDAVYETALDIPEGVASFMNVHYGGVCSGTRLISDLRDVSNATQLADHLVALIAQMHQIGRDSAKAPESPN